MINKTDAKATEMFDWSNQISLYYRPWIFLLILREEKMNFSIDFFMH